MEGNGRVVLGHKACTATAQNNQGEKKVGSDIEYSESMTARRNRPIRSLMQAGRSSGAVLVSVSR